MLLKIKNLAGLFLLLPFFGVGQHITRQELKQYVSGAPFQMVVPQLPQFPDSKVNIKNFGAVGDGQTLNTRAITAAIDACVKKGGGMVVIPPGLWLTGPIELKNNINLHLQRGAILLFSRDHSLYPIIRTSASSHSWFVKSPIYGYHLHDIAITGEGIMNGSGDSWRPVKKSKTTQDQWKDLLQSGGVVSPDGKIWWPDTEALNGKTYYKKIKKNKSKNAIAKDFLPVRDYLRPYMVSLIDCDRVLINGTTFMNAPKFALKPKNCTNLVFKNVKINNEWYAQNGDGIDLSACRNAIVYKCTVNAGDDGICMKSSRSSSDYTDTARLRNIIVADCIVYRGHGGFVIGSNTDGGMENIWVHNCDFINTDIGIRIKSARDRGGKVHNVYISNIYMAAIKSQAVLFSTYYENEKQKNVSHRSQITTTTPRFSHFYLKNIYCNGAKTAITLAGLPEMPLRHLSFSNVNISAQKGIIASDTSHISFHHVKINGKAKETESIQ